MDLGSGIKLIHGDCLEEMKHIPDGSVDCIITSPPYNVGIKYNSYFDKIDYCDYIKFIEIFIDSYFHKLSPDGRICINIGDAKNGSIPTHSDFIQILKKYRFIPITTIIWNKNTTSNRCAWGSYLSAKSPSFPRGYEFILIFGKTKSKLSNGTSTITKEEWKEYSNGLWTFAPENKQKEIGHPAMFPIELPTEKAVEYQKKHKGIDENLLKHISPLNWSHINFLGEYSFQSNMALGLNEYRPLKV